MVVVTIFNPPAPEVTVTIKLSKAEAVAVREALGYTKVITGTYDVYDKLGDTLRDAGIIV